MKCIITAKFIADYSDPDEAIRDFKLQVINNISKFRIKEISVERKKWKQS